MRNPDGWHLNRHRHRWEYWVGGKLMTWVTKMPDNKFLGFIGWKPESA